jgi:penicillin-binding protein 2
VTDRSRLRLVVLGVLVISLVATLLGRLWYLQVLAAPQFEAIANQSQTHEIVTEAPRGDIVDDAGRPLVNNKTALVISVDRTALSEQTDGGRGVLHRLSKLIKVPYRTLVLETRQCGPDSTGHVVKAPCWGGSAYQPIPVSRLKPSTAATKRAFQIDEQQEKYKGVSAQPEAVRNYPEPDGAQAAAVLGYVQQISADQLKTLTPAQQKIELNSQVGATGIEASYDKYLRGKPGVKKVTVDHLGAVTGTVQDTSPTAGDEIVTNIDAKVQSQLETQLQNAIDTARSQTIDNTGGEHYTADYAAGVVMNVRTGGIVAMASNPSYDPRKPPPLYNSVKKFNQYAHSLGHPFVDKAFGSFNPPGSTFKMISSSGLLYDHALTTSQLHDCPTNYKGRHSFDKTPGLGPISLRDALIVSCDTYFFELGEQDWKVDDHLVGAGQKPREGVQKVAHDYGLGVDPGIDIPGAVEGHIADRYNTKLYWEETKDQYCKGAQNKSFSYQHRLDDRVYCHSGYVFLPGDQENQDVGQGTVGASPLQMAVAYSALANGGKVYEPRVVKAIFSPTGKLVRRVHAPVRDHIPLSKSDLDYLRSALYGVTQSTSPLGTATGVFAGFPQNKVLVGGKTGTAELSGTTNQNGSWFASFAGPAAGKPQFVTVIEVDKSNQGAISAAPFVRNMWESIYGLRGQPALFPNGVPPTKLPKVGAAAIRQQAARERARADHHSSSSSGSTTSTTSPPPPSSPATTASGLPPGLPVNLRGEVRE